MTLLKNLILFLQKQCKIHYIILILQRIYQLLMEPLENDKVFLLVLKISNIGRLLTIYLSRMFSISSFLGNFAPYNLGLLNCVSLFYTFLCLSVCPSPYLSVCLFISPSLSLFYLTPFLCLFLSLCLTLFL